MAPGPHRIGVCFRYRGQRRRARLAEASREFTVDESARRVEIEIRLGVRNGSDFRIAEPVTR
ncbi:hypothetical protein OG204_12025 [Streptomyces sp. NBC_01387]|uniref:hypothetical protein n=1 Tax=unclassified Streptomyces TaxID=2593676 RepID=UPI002024ABC0|nr:MULTISPECIES: hypothetical protein [unclassified Streptomyces]MCX4551028.1 hypothetical protein [Streptomyces sp. NBC_01500]WSV56285.1 hypothetical protein OG282_22780 [Streptomyces sp. NBC_01014]